MAELGNAKLLRTHSSRLNREAPPSGVRPVNSNVRASADHLRHGSQILEQFIQNEGLLVVGAEYSLETGVVEFFDGDPAAG